MHIFSGLLKTPQNISQSAASTGQYRTPVAASIGCKRKRSSAKLYKSYENSIAWGAPLDPWHYFSGTDDPAGEIAPEIPSSCAGTITCCGPATRYLRLGRLREESLRKYLRIPHAHCLWRSEWHAEVPGAHPRWNLLPARCCIYIHERRPRRKPGDARVGVRFSRTRRQLVKAALFSDR